MQTRDGSSETRIGLIAGSGRSGTTILRTIFSRHPDVATFRTEIRFLIDPDGLVDFYDGMRAGWSPYVYEQKVQRLFRLLEDVGSPEFAHRLRGADLAATAQAKRKTSSVHALLATGRDIVKSSRVMPRYFSVNVTSSCPRFPALVEELKRELVEFEFEGRWAGTPRWAPSSMLLGPATRLPLQEVLGDFFRAVASCTAREQGATHVLEDSPLNHLSFDRTLDLLPEARLVCIHRDPRDVVASLVTMPWAPSDAGQAARLYLRIAEEWERVRQGLPEGSYMEIRLEDLVDEPERVLRSVAGFWSVRWDESLLQTDLGRSNRGRWKKDLTRQQQRQVAEVLAPELARLGLE